MSSSGKSIVIDFPQASVQSFGVHPALSLALGDAPLSKSNMTQPACPFAQAA
jgi:hypothetical protein